MVIGQKKTILVLHLAGQVPLAGVAWQDGEQKIQIPSWGTGWGVRLLNRLVKEHFET